MTNHIVLKKELSSALLAELGGDAHLRDIRLPLFGSLGVLSVFTVASRH